MYGVVLPPGVLPPALDWCAVHHRPGSVVVKRQALRYRGQWDAVLSFVVPVTVEAHEPFTAGLAERGHEVARGRSLGSLADTGLPVHLLVGVEQHAWVMREYDVALVQHINATVPGVTITDTHVIVDVDAVQLGVRGDPEVG